MISTRSDAVICDSRNLIAGFLRAQLLGRLHGGHVEEQAQQPPVLIADARLLAVGATTGFLPARTRRGALSLRASWRVVAPNETGVSGSALSF